MIVYVPWHPAFDQWPAKELNEYLFNALTDQGECIASNICRTDGPRKWFMLPSWYMRPCLLERVS